MSSEKERISVEDLLVPIEGQNPSGADLRYTALFDEIRRARSRGDLNGDWASSAEGPDWETVIRLSAGALRTQTKDLTLAAWLAEALVATGGLAGVRDGIQLLRLMIDTFWDTLYPEIDDGDLEERANYLVWLDRKLDAAIRNIPITDSSAGSGYSFNQWQESTRYVIPANPDDLELAQSVRECAAQEGKITSEQWKTARDATPDSFFAHLSALATECRQELECLEEVVESRFGRQAPGFDRTRGCLENMKELFYQLIQPSHRKAAERA